MLVQMVSDANTAGSGFFAMYSAAQPNEREQYTPAQAVQHSDRDVNHHHHPCENTHWYSKLFIPGVGNPSPLGLFHCRFSRPIFSDGNEIVIQFLSDLSLTADGFIGYYKFRPKKYPTTTVSPITTPTQATTGATTLKYTAALCQQKCKRSGTLESNYCSSNFGLNYLFMGHTDEEGRGKIAPNNFVMAFKSKNQKNLNTLKNKRC
ncbi:UNVERIFIED_CONTAM: hypothetical protein FKN15_015307 [Acipenser sinensis]